MTAKRTNPRKDINETAFSIVQQATGEGPQAEPISEEKKSAIDSGRRGGLKGGIARAEKLTTEQRSEIARKAAATRWRK
jgi:hypothetical protein